MNIITQLPLYIKKENFNNKNVKMIKEEINSRIDDYGVLYGELIESTKLNHFDTSFRNVSHTVKTINPLDSNVSIIPLSATKNGKLLLDMIFELDMVAVVRDSFSPNSYGYIFHTIDVVDYIPYGFIPLSCMRKEKIKRLLK